MESDVWDAIVVGAGAAGLLAAARAGERGLRVILLEKNRKAGVKILMSGGTRCNITHNCDARGIVAAFGKNGPFLHSALAALGPRDVVELFHRENVPTKVEETGKVFPVSDRALDVRDALVRRLLRSSATLALAEPALDVKKVGEAFEVFTPFRTHRAKKLLITVGGQSYPGCGTVGDGYLWAHRFGHTIVPPRPALVPIATPTAWARGLAGLTLDVDVSVIDLQAGDKRRAVLAAERGSFLFTHVGVSGPAPLNVSRAISERPTPAGLRLQCDFLPGTKATALADELRRRAKAHGKRKAVGLVEELPDRLVEALAAETGLPETRNAAELSTAELERLVAAIKETRLPIAGVLGFEKAEVTAGGVALAEVDSRTLASKLVPGLHFAGEILDLDGKIGGYNFQAAFSTGRLAAEHL